MASKYQTTQKVDATPLLKQKSYELQKYGQMHPAPIGLPERACKENCEALNQLLADSMTLYELYKKTHWQVTGPTFYALHLLYDKHAEEVERSIDTIAERIQTLGGVATGMCFEVSRQTRVEHPPTGMENVSAQISRLIAAHNVVIQKARDTIDLTNSNKDWGTNDILMSDVLRMHEMQTWFISQHLVDEPLNDQA